MRRIFRLFVNGTGMKGIARKLNDDHVSSPRAGTRGTGSWAPSQIRSMLSNERYAGVIEWGRHRKAYRGGTKVRLKQADQDVVRVEVPELRIVDPALWAASRARFAKRARGEVPLGGREPRHLLSLLSRCSECGGPVGVESGRHGDERVKLYVCSYHRSRGRAVCTNNLRRPITEVNQAMTTFIHDKVLSEHAVIETVHEIRRRLLERAEEARPQLDMLEEEAEGLRAQIVNLAEAIGMMKGSSALTTALAGKEAKLKAIEMKLGVARAAPEAIDLECHRLEAEALQRAQELRAQLDGGVDIEARAVVAQLADGPLRFTAESTPEGRRYRITGEVDTSALLGHVSTETSRVPARPKVAKSGVLEMTSQPGTVLL